MKNQNAGVSWVRLGLIFVSLFALGGRVGLPQAAQAMSDFADKEADGGGGYSSCGGDVPWPFQVSNQAVELADGERYLLVGQIEIVRDRVYFNVDLVKQEWLANAKRRKNPRYLIEGEPAYWSNYAGKRVRVAVRAKWLVVEALRGGHKVEIVLQAQADPAVASAENNKKNRH